MDLFITTVTNTHFIDTGHLIAKSFYLVSWIVSFIFLVLSFMVFDTQQLLPIFKSVRTQVKVVWGTMSVIYMSLVVALGMMLPLYYLMTAYDAYQIISTQSYVLIAIWMLIIALFHFWVAKFQSKKLIDWVTHHIAVDNR